ncbi:MAG: ferritin family protein [Moorellales bacterium]
MRTLLWEAITAEQNLSQAYRRWAQQATRPEFSRLFLQLAEQHQQHAETLRARLASAP